MAMADLIAEDNAIESMPAPSATKRSAVDQSSDRAAKRRSTVACLSCRSRKVRCDVVACEDRCTNCRLDDIPCMVKDSNRGKRPNGQGAAASPSVSCQQPQQTQMQHVHEQRDEEEHEQPQQDSHRLHQHQPQRQEYRPQPSPGQRQQLGQQSQTQPPGESPRLEQTDEYLLTLTFEDPPRRNGPEPHSDHHHPQLYIHTHSLSPGDCTTPNQSNGRSGESPAPASGWSQKISRVLPACFRHLPRHIGAEDLEYLTKKGALTIPDDEFRDELLRTYIKVVYPFMPAIDLEAFIVPIISGRSSHLVSFLLFQAVMFVSITFVDTSYLRSRGFSSRKTARKTFFNRVRSLYSLDCEPDRLSLIQALLLMTFWYDTPEDEKDTWYWMGITLSIGQIIGIHRDPKDLNISKQEKKLRTRIWWSCFMRDRLLALGIRRPIRIQEKEFNVPMLSLDDFDLSPLSEELRGLFRGPSNTEFQPESRRMVSLMCIDLAKLCLCLGRILHTQYSVLGDQPIASDYSAKVVVMPRRSDKQARKFGECDTELEKWLQDQDTCCRYISPHQRPVSVSQEEDMVKLHRALLYMIYLTTLGALHRPQVFHPRPGSANTIIDKETSRRKVTNAAIAMTKLAYDLQCHNQLRYLSTSSIPAFLSATLIHLLDIRHPEEDVRNVSIGRFYQCLQVLHQLRDMYASADYAIYFLQTVLESIQAYIPMLNPGIRLSPYGTSPAQSNQMPVASPQIAANPGNLMGMVNGYSMPPDFRNLQPLGVSQTNAAAPGLESSQRTTSPLQTFGDLTQANTFYGGLQSAIEQVPGNMANWGEYDNLLPALLNFDIDPSLFTSSNGARAPLT